MSQLSARSIAAASSAVPTPRRMPVVAHRHADARRRGGGAATSTATCSPRLPTTSPADFGDEQIVVRRDIGEPLAPHLGRGQRHLQRAGHAPAATRIVAWIASASRTSARRIVIGGSPRRHHGPRNAAITASPIARVPMTFSPGSAMSPVRWPWLQDAARTACSMRSRNVGAARTCSGTSSPATGSSPADWPCPVPRCPGAEPWIGSYRPLLRRVERRRRQHADRPGEHRRLVGQDVAEHVAGDDDVELLRVAARAASRRCRRTCATARRPDILRAIALTISRHRMLGIEHVGLVHRAQPLAPRCAPSRNPTRAMRRISGTL